MAWQRKFDARAIEDIDDLILVPVTDKNTLPPGVRNHPRVCKLVDEGHLFLLNLVYRPDDIFKVGVYNDLDFSAPAKLRCVEILRRVPQTSILQCYVRLETAEGVFENALSMLKGKMKVELKSPLYPEYMSKKGNYV